MLLIALGSVLGSVVLVVVAVVRVGVLGVVSFFRVAFGVVAVVVVTRSRCGSPGEGLDPAPGNEQLLC